MIPICEWGRTRVGDCMSLSFFPELYPGGKKERERGNHCRKTTAAQRPDRKQPGEKKITSDLVPEGSAVCHLYFCFFPFEYFKNWYLSCSLCLGIYSYNRGSDPRLWALVWRCRLGLAVWTLNWWFPAPVFGFGVCWAP